jgi:hypothetical protein
MIRQIVEITNENYNLKIPKQYLNRKIEILILPYDIDTESINTSPARDNDFIFKMTNNPTAIDESIHFLTRDEANAR